MHRIVVAYLGLGPGAARRQFNAKPNEGKVVFRFNPLWMSGTLFNKRSERCITQ